MRTTFDVMGRNLVAFAALSMIFAGLPALVVTWLSLQGPVKGAPLNAAAVNLGTSLVTIVTNAILQGSLVHLTAADLNGRRATIVDGAITGMRNFLPLIGIAILWGLCVGLGLIVFVAPGLFLAASWAAATPACVIERLGVGSSFARSRVLTENNRWRIGGLFAIYLVTAFAIQMMIEALFGGPESTGMTGVIFVVGTTAATVLTSMVGATGTAALYMELRWLRDGVGPSELAAVFD